MQDHGPASARSRRASRWYGIPRTCRRGAQRTGRRADHLSRSALGLLAYGSSGMSQGRDAVCYSLGGGCNTSRCEAKGEPPHASSERNENARTGRDPPLLSQCSDFAKSHGFQAFSGASGCGAAPHAVRRPSTPSSISACPVLGSARCTRQRSSKQWGPPPFRFLPTGRSASFRKRLMRTRNPGSDVQSVRSCGWIWSPKFVSLVLEERSGGAWNPLH